MVYPYSSLVSRSRIPKFPTPPAKTFVTRSMPSDLVANKRNYYTEITFVDFRSGVYGIGSPMATTINSILESGSVESGATGATTGGVVGGLTGAVVGGVTGGVGGALVGAGVGAIAGAGFGALGLNPLGFATVGAIRLPIPNNVNDIMTFSWSDTSARDFLPGNQLTRAAAQGVGFLVGKTLNPLLFAAFNRPNFRTFKFDWALAPRNRQESETIRTITQTFKHAASPSGGVFMDYPYVAMLRMYPNNLNGHAIFKPMVVRSIGISLTPNPTPSFFENTGAPTIVNLSVDMMEIKIWTREEIIP